MATEYGLFLAVERDGVARLGRRRGSRLGEEQPETEGREDAVHRLLAAGDQLLAGGSRAGTQPQSIWVVVPAYPSRPNEMYSFAEWLKEPDLLRLRHRQCSWCSTCRSATADIWTATSTFALSRGFAGRAGRMTVP
jgi:hypothetical protein